jgi:hypothetical protein
MPARQEVATLGQFFGDLALLDRARRIATVTAVTPMELVVLGQREFSALIDEVRPRASCSPDLPTATGIRRNSSVALEAVSAKQQWFACACRA